MRHTKILCIIMVAVLWIIGYMAPLALSDVSEPVIMTASAQDFARGDINGDGRVNMVDAMVLYRYVSGADVTMTVAQLKRADVSNDSDINMVDAMQLYTIASGAATVPTTPVTVTTTTTTTTKAPTTTTKKPTTTTKKPTTTTTTTTTTSGPSTTATTTPTAVRGIDVSYAQGSVDWQSVKKDNVEFAVLRCGYGQDQTDQDDSRFDEYAAACERYDIPYGAYLFCYARNATEAAGEAKHALRLLEGKNLTLPVFLDMEDSSWQGNLTPKQCAEIATVFCETLSEAGYKVGVYANLNWWKTKLTDPCFNQWYRWVAQYNTTCEYQGTFHMWQYSENGTVDGIDSKVDMNYCYLDPRAF